MVATHDNTKAYLPLSGRNNDGWSNDKEATATCYCGSVQLKFPTEGPGLITTFLCNCTDCHKFTASIFASNFVIDDNYLTHIRGKENLTIYSQSETIASGNNMSNHFCKTCGTLLYRVSSGFPGNSIMRIGTVDDFSLHETKLRPRFEQFIKDRPDWLSGALGVRQVEESGF